MAEEFRDDYEVAQDVVGCVVVEAGGRGDRGDDVVGAADAAALAALVVLVGRARARGALWSRDA